ncbi:Hypothetical protein SRAE_1000284700 [Strongyloides ratti]|uniref:Uncharacterized protein n=1 Tax=Strongyloides ratti TaxID=34506 RepID=A0A090MX05_STRRB|nr:Hypothetical protein SRAE_1000284700 [Strongyloides ratti]CEF64594.1 Hypothetical protein SRAE_1000284700 [Strongyloides ratti]
MPQKNMNGIIFILLLIFAINGNILSFEYDVESQHNQRFLDDTYKPPHMKENIFRNELFLQNIEKNIPDVIPTYTRKVLQPPPLKRSIWRFRKSLIIPKDNDDIFYY